MSWEYQSFHFPVIGGLVRDATVDTKGFDQALNALGEAGWELVAVVGIQNNVGRTDTVVATFKRLKK
jgi:hypothetical protein